MSLHEAAGETLVPARRRNLPYRTLRAFDNAVHLLGLNRGARDALAEISRFVDQNLPFKTVFAHKVTIAQRIGMSERSLYRHMVTLQDHELIEVLEQDRKSHNGRFTVSRIRLTRKAAELLGLIEAPAEPGLQGTAPHTPAPPPPPAPQASQDQSSATSTDPVIHRPPSAKLAAGHMLSVPTYSRNQPPMRTENGLPQDLSWLTGNGLSRAGIFKLMGMAKRRAKQLSDVVTVARVNLQGLTGGRLFAYLAKLVAGPTDFAMAATVERQRFEAVRQAQRWQAKVTAFRLRFRNLALTNRQQSRLYVIDDRAAFVQVFGGPYPTSAPLNDLREWIERLESGNLVLATLATERRLMM